MKIRNQFLVLMALLLLSGFLSTIHVWAEEATTTPVLLGEEEITQQKIKTIIEAASYSTKIDEDGDLLVTSGNFKFLIKVDKEKKLVSYIALFRIRSGASDKKKLELANRLNDEVVFVRFCIIKEKLLYCDYFLLFEGGLAPQAILNNFRYFQKVCEKIVYLDKDNVLE